jgi:hypothetical protein
MSKKRSRHRVKRPRIVTEPASQYFAASERDMWLFHFVVETVFMGDYVEYLAKRALDGGTGDECSTPTELARTTPGTLTLALVKQSQLLYEMFLARSVDNFGKYLVDLIRQVLQKQPSILKSRQQSLTLEDILQHSSIDDLVHSIIEAKVNALSYEGFDSMLEWCTSRAIPLQVPNEKKNIVIELIATRNLIVHNRCIVDEKYVRTVGGTMRKVGDLRDLELHDFTQALELLDSIVIATDKASARKFRLRHKALTISTVDKHNAEKTPSTV